MSSYWHKTEVRDVRLRSAFEFCADASSRLAEA
jgi:hypothetical protein